MAATYRTSAAGGSTTGTSDRTATITPASGDLFVVLCLVAANSNSTPTCSDNNGSGTYDRIDVATILIGAVNYRLSAFVRTARLTNTTSTVVTVATGSNTSGSVIVIAVAGMFLSGSKAIRTTGKQDDQAAGTPGPTLSQSALTGNMTIGVVANGTNPAGMTTAAGWTERHDVGFNSDAHGLEIITRDSGFTGTTVTWGSASASRFASMILELDGSAASMTAAQGSYALTGQAVGLNLGRKLVLAQGSLTLTGQWVTLRATGRPTLIAAGALGLATSHTIPSTGTITPAANKLILIGYRSAIGVGPAAVPAASGCGLTFAEHAGASVLDTSTTLRAGWLRAMDAAAVNGTITVTFAAAQSLRYSVIEFDTIALVTGNNGADAIRNVATGAQDNTTPLGPINYAAFSDAGNAAIAVGATTTAGNQTPRAGWTELYDDTAALGVQYKLTSDTAWEVAHTAAAAFGVGIELIRAAAAAYTLALGQGSYTLSGQAVSLLAQRKLTAAQGAYALTGQTTGLLAGRKLTAAQGSYALSGQVVNLLRGLRLALAQGSYSLSGQAVTLTYSPATGYTLALGQGSYALSGQTVALLARHVLAADQGAYALSGQAVAFLRSLILAAEQGSYILSGQAVTLSFTALSTATTLPVILAAITALLEDLTPADQSDTGFRRGPRRVDLRRQPATSALLRRFQVMRAGPREEPGHATDTVYVARKVRLEVAYPAALVGLYGDEDLDDLADIMDADARQIADALSSPANVANGGHKANFVVIEKPDRTAAVWFQPFTIDVRYFTPESSS